jgi:hypothetical protein
VRAYLYYRAKVIYLYEKVNDPMRPVRRDTVMSVLVDGHLKLPTAARKLVPHLCNVSWGWRRFPSRVDMCCVFAD